MATTKLTSTKQRLVILAADGVDGCVGPSTTTMKLEANFVVVVNWLPMQTATSWLTMIVGHNLESQSATLLCMTFLWLGALS